MAQHTHWFNLAQRILLVHFSDQSFTNWQQVYPQLWVSYISIDLHYMIFDSKFKIIRCFSKNRMLKWIVLSLQYHPNIQQVNKYHITILIKRTVEPYLSDFRLIILPVKNRRTYKKVKQPTKIVCVTKYFGHERKVTVKTSDHKGRV